MINVLLWAQCKTERVKAWHYVSIVYMVATKQDVKTIRKKERRENHYIRVTTLSIWFSGKYLSGVLWQTQKAFPDFSNHVDEKVLPLPDKKKTICKPFFKFCLFFLILTNILLYWHILTFLSNIWNIHRKYSLCFTERARTYVMEIK